jgi:hypothetical protein
MKIICAGLHKTGTKSLAKSLRILGYKVYDFDDQLLYYGDEWYDLYYRDKVPDFYRMFKDVDAVVDFPSNLYFEELMEAFPEAKVILSIRRDEEAWMRSCRKQIRSNFYMKWIRYLLPTYNMFYLIGNAQLNASNGTTNPNASYIYRKRYRWHNDRVKSVVPAEKLLVYSVEEGWEPLCEFTGKKIPNQPFPHLNKNCTILSTYEIETEFGRKIARELKFVKICFAIFVAVMAVLSTYIFILL